MISGLGYLGFWVWECPQLRHLGFQLPRHAWTRSRQLMKLSAKLCLIHYLALRALRLMSDAGVSVFLTTPLAWPKVASFVLLGFRV